MFVLIGTHYSCQVLMKLEFSRLMFKKILKINFVKIRPVGAGLFHVDGRTDRHDQTNSRFSQCSERA